jgi:uncharacterized protein
VLCYFVKYNLTQGLEGAKLVSTYPLRSLRLCVRSAKLQIMVHKILITGASGLVGSRLTELLLQKGHQVAHLGRSKRAGKVPSFVWDVENKSLDAEALNGVDTIINLAGAGVADKRWTDQRKKEILDSRTHSTRLLFETLKKQNHTVKTFVGASAIGYYGFGLHDEVLTEESNAGNDFLASVTKQWEEETDRISSLGARVVKLRIGIVLSDKGGALVEMTKPIRFGIGSPLGSGQQYMSWIHIDDLCEMFIKAIEDEKMLGAYNAVTAWATNVDFTKAVANILKKPLWLPPVPSFIMKIILGEMANLVVNGSKVSSEKIKKVGLQFKHPELRGALEDLLVES